MPALIDHLERRLGRMTNSWRGESNPGLPTFSVGCFAGGYLANATSYVTLGLSKVPLHRSGYDQHFYLEFVFAVHDPSGTTCFRVLDALEFVWSRSVTSREAMVRGEVVKLPPGSIVASRFSHLYAALPVYYDNDFKSVAVENGDRVAIVWLVPVTTGEATLVSRQGWENFEQELIKHDPDLMALDRVEIA